MTMKLSDALILHAEWWFVHTYEHDFELREKGNTYEVAKHLSDIWSNDSRMCLSLEAESYLCLFEAEYQKDIESSQEEKEELITVIRSNPPTEVKEVSEESKDILSNLTGPVAPTDKQS